jgi:hypothetical protein
VEPLAAFRRYDEPMKRVVLVLSAAVPMVALALLAAGRLGWLQGQRPRDLGVSEGRLKPHSPTPNSVSSQARLYPGHPMQERADIAPSQRLRFAFDDKREVEEVARSAGRRDARALLRDDLGGRLDANTVAAATTSRTDCR